MCGIFGYYTFGTPKELSAILQVLFTGLKRLEYRGYDSSGLCVDSAEAPGRMSTDGTCSPLSSCNGTPGAAIEAALAGSGCSTPHAPPLGGEPVIIKSVGKIANLEELTDAYIKEHVRAAGCAERVSRCCAGTCMRRTAPADCCSRS
jgi:asparagine synthetase B (glutamine-hydrolysing)